MSRILSILAGGLVVVIMSGTSGDALAANASCAERFPEAEWETVTDGAVTIETSGVSQALRDRFAQEIALVTGWIADDMGLFTTTVCLVSPDSTFDESRYEVGTRRFHAHSDLPDRLLVLSAHRVGFIAPAAAFALSQHALWQHHGNEPFPEPIASVVGQWYRARILDRLEQYHADRVYSNFFETEAVVDWTVRTQEPVQDWDPENNFTSIGDFMDFAVTNHGTEVLLETDGDRWREIEGEWRVGLRNDLRGRDTDTTGWIGGVAVTVLAVIIALAAIGLGFWAKRRSGERVETPPPIPGFFSESESGAQNAEPGEEAQRLPKASSGSES